MNDNQKRVLIVVAVIIFGLLLYPPWRHEGAVAYTTYGWIWGNHMATVDAGLLISQWIGVLIIGGIIYCLFND